jgi:hypothetical protein
MTVGALRNEANRLTDEGEVLVHWDSDDVSHERRIEEQVALLQASGADAVGYSDMLFWRGPQLYKPDGEAWLYLGPQKALGTSLCYWRKTWEHKPFPDQPRRGFASGEDTDWIKGLNLATASSLFFPGETSNTPRMIASIHSDNTSGSYRLMEHSDSWRRIPEWDAYCRNRMAL